MREEEGEKGRKHVNEGGRKRREKETKGEERKEV